MLKDLNDAPEGALVVLHGCAHNPSGVDPSHEEWKKIADVCQTKKLFTILDVAYQGMITKHSKRIGIEIMLNIFMLKLFFHLKLC